jgi:hypothetical protein
MRRLLALLAMATLVVGYGSSVAAAVCQHQSLREHVAARDSAGGQLAAAALSEEAAASTDAKKGSVSTAPILPPADLSRLAAFAFPPRATEPSGRRLTDTPLLSGLSVLPLLHPPSIGMEHA